MVPLVAYNYSAKNYKRMSSFATAARTAGMGFAFFCVIMFEIFATPIILLFIESPETVAYATDFLRIAVLATPFMICNIQMSYTFQAMGKGVKSLILTSCRQGLINIPLLFTMNYLFGLYGIICTQLISDGITVIISVILYTMLFKQLKKEVDAFKKETVSVNNIALQ
jgi:Na+-driven multidrug efflux pump